MDKQQTMELAGESVAEAISEEAALIDLQAAARDYGFIQSLGKHPQERPAADALLRAAVDYHQACVAALEWRTPTWGNQ